MGTDWVELFDLDLAKVVIRLDRPGLERFLRERGPALVDRDRRTAEAFHADVTEQMRASARSVVVVGQHGPDAERTARAREEAVRELEDGLASHLAELVEQAAGRWSGLAERLREGDDLPDLRRQVAWAAGALSHELPLDYWGCLAAALQGADVERTCETNLVLEPDNPDGATVFFLGPPQVDLMIASLRANWSQVERMGDADLRRLVEYRGRCADEPGVRVAYHIDY